MEFVIVKLGKPAFESYRPIVAEYVKRIQRFHRIETVEIRISGDSLSDREVKAIEKRLTNSDLSIFLNEEGKEHSSRSISLELLKMQNDTRIQRVLLLVGGPFGLPESLQNKFDAQWSLSGCTLTSDMAWLLLIEQLYRGFQILSGSAYHHD